MAFGAIDDAERDDIAELAARYEATHFLVP
jgi:hypothetical protein